MLFGKLKFPVLAVTLLLLPTVAGSGTAPPPPTAVAAVVTGTAGALVYWAPVPEADAVYRVYGVTTTGSLVHLEDTDLAVAHVSAVYPNYAVTTMVNGVESAPTYGGGMICVRFIQDPPYVQVEDDCTVGVYGGIVVPRPLP